MKSIHKIACIMSFLAFTVLASSSSAFAYQQLIASPGFLNFGQVDIGQRVGTTIFVQNVGNEDIPFVSANAMGDFDFNADSFCGFLPRYSSCTIQVMFAPTSEGMHSTDIQIQGGMASTSVQAEGMGFQRQ
jgi:hypothetical protein